MTTLKIPRIVPGASWTGSTSTKGKIFSTASIYPRRARAEITFTGNPVNNDNIIFSDGTPLTYTIKTTPVDPRDVLIGATATDTLVNLASEINLNDAGIYKAMIDGSTLFLEKIDQAAGVASTFDTSKSAGTSIEIRDFWDNAATPIAVPTNPTTETITGNEGALPYSGSSVTFSVDGTPIAALVLGPYTTAHDNTDIAAEIGALANIDSTIVATPGHIDVERNTAGIALSIKVSSTAPNNLETNGWIAPIFEVGQFSEGTTADHPSNDVTSTDYVRIMHPADPLFFRNTNRPLIDLYENERRIYEELIGLRDGYSLSTGLRLGTTNPKIHFKGDNYTFKGNLTVEGNIILSGDYIQQNVAVLQVSDKVIIANVGETGAGVTDTGESGLVIDRGTFENTKFTWNEGIAISDKNYILTDPIDTEGGHWIVDGAIIGSALGNRALVVGRREGSAAVGTVVEFEQVTIGDGETTFGTFNAGAGATYNIATALSDAIAFLGANGGKIFIKRGNYTLNAKLNIDVSNITIEGEGACTIIRMPTDGFFIEVGNALATSNVLISNLQLRRTDTATNPMLELDATNATFCIVDKVWFTETAASVDITFDVADGHLLNGISQTTSTNLP